MAENYTFNDDSGDSESLSNELKLLLSELSIDQRRFIIARMDYPSDKEAAEAIGLKPNTVTRWSKKVKRAAELFSRDIATGVLELRRLSFAKAMMVKTAGLDSSDEKVRQAVATEIIEWENGKARQQVDLSGSVTTIVKGYTVAANPDQWDAPNDDPK